MVEEITLKVVEAKQRDVGRKIARIDSEIMKKLDLVPNDIVEIIGKKSTTAIVWPAYREDEKAGIIRIDGETRRNAGVAVEDVVQIRKAKAKPAEKVVLAPFEQLPFIGDIGRIVLVQLMNRPVSKGDVLVVPILGVGLELKVISTNPPPPVIINEETSIEISRTPVKREEEITEKIEEIEEINEKIKGIKKVLNEIEKDFSVKAKIKDFYLNYLKIEKESSSFGSNRHYDINVNIELIYEDKNEDVLDNATFNLVRKLIELGTNIINAEVNKEKQIAFFTIKL